MPRDIVNISFLLPRRASRAPRSYFRMFSGLKLCMAPAKEGAPQVRMFPDIVSDIPQELYTRRYAPLWSLSMSRPLTHVHYTTATDVSEYDVAQVPDS